MTKKGGDRDDKKKRGGGYEQKLRFCKLLIFEIDSRREIWFNFLLFKILNIMTPPLIEELKAVFLKIDEATRDYPRRQGQSRLEGQMPIGELEDFVYETKLRIQRVPRRNDIEQKDIVGCVDVIRQQLAQLEASV